MTRICSILWKWYSQIFWKGAKCRQYAQCTHIYIYHTKPKLATAARELKSVIPGTYALSICSFLVVDQPDLTITTVAIYSSFDSSIAYICLAGPHRIHGYPNGPGTQTHTYSVHVHFNSNPEAEAATEAMWCVVVYLNGRQLWWRYGYFGGVLMLSFWPRTTHKKTHTHTIHNAQYTYILYGTILYNTQSMLLHIQWASCTKCSTGDGETYGAILPCSSTFN